MAEQIGVNYYLRLSGTTDLSSKLEDLKITYSGDLQEYVVANPGGTAVHKKRLVGPLDFQVTATFADDPAASSVHQTLRTLFGTTFQVDAGIFGSTPGSASEVWTATMTFAEFTVGGAAGQRLQKQVTFVLASGTPTADVTP